MQDRGLRVLRKQGEPELLARRSCSQRGSALISKQGGQTKQGTVGVLGCASLDPRRNLGAAVGARAVAHAVQELRALVVAEFLKRREAALQGMRRWVLGLRGFVLWQEVGWIVEGDFDEYITRQ